MRRVFLAAILVMILIAMLIPFSVSAQTRCPSGFIQTTLQAEDKPNLFRLGLKYGVSWTRIVTPNGAHPVPERVFPNTILCVPTGGTVIVIVGSSGSTTATPIAVAAANPIEEYCRGVPVHGIPDRGSCLMEAEAIAFGAHHVVEFGVECEQRDIAVVRGVLAMCNVHGNMWLSIQPGF